MRSTAFWVCVPKPAEMLAEVTAGLCGASSAPGGQVVSVGGLDGQPRGHEQGSREEERGGLQRTRPACSTGASPISAGGTSCRPVVSEGLPARVRAPPKSVDARGGCQTVPALKEAPPELKQRPNEQGLRSLTDGARPAAFPRWRAGGRRWPCAPGAWVPSEQERRSRRPGCWPRGGAGDAGDGAAAISMARAGARRGCSRGGGGAGFPSRRRPRFRSVGGTSRGARGEGANSAEAACPPRLRGALPAGQSLQGPRRSAVGDRGAGRLGSRAAPCARSRRQRSEPRAAPGKRNRAAVALRDQLPRGSRPPPPNLLAGKSSLK